MAVADDDLDELLDSALDDFTNLDLGGANTATQRAGKSSLPPAASSSSAAPVQGLGMPDLKVRKKEKQRRSTAATAGRSNFASEALEKLTRETRAALREIESATSPGGGLGAGMQRGQGASGNISGGEMEEEAIEEFVKQFEEFSSSQDMDSIVESMMQQLLSKDMLHEPMREIVDRYPKWLHEHKNGLSKNDYDRFSRQYELMLKLNEVYDNEPSNFAKVIDLMQKIQECGNPPNDILRDIAPDIDLNSMAQLSPDTFGSASNCCVM